MGTPYPTTHPCQGGSTTSIVTAAKSDAGTTPSPLPHTGGRPIDPTKDSQPRGAKPGPRPGNRKGGMPKGYKFKK